jgi:hypothetical protein
VAVVAASESLGPILQRPLEGLEEEAMAATGLEVLEQSALLAR